MNKITFLIFTQFLLTLLQLFAGNFGFVLPLALLGALYIVLALGKLWGFAAALMSGCVFSVLYGGSWNLLYIVTDPLLALGLGWWIDRHDEDVAVNFWQPGAAGGIASSLPAWWSLVFLWNESGHFPSELPWLLVQTLWSAAVSAALFMLLILLGEAATEFLGLPRFLTRKNGGER